ncbi:MAG: hypothetical protein ABSH25_14655 [Syntrophorhabdales bacterium]
MEQRCAEALPNPANSDTPTCGSVEVSWLEEIDGLPYSRFRGGPGR